jgi:FtsZ-binding cell division protein ZapB
MHVLLNLPRIDNIKKHCLDKFLHHKQDLQAKELDDVRKWIEREVDERADEII